MDNERSPENWVKATNKDKDKFKKLSPKQRKNIQEAEESFK